MGRPATPIRLRFWDKVNVTSPSGCWLWKGAKDCEGYGFIKRKDGVQLRAHRMSYEFYQGPIPDNYQICHHCDNPSCVNPNHLFAGTNSDNMRDCIRKNRKPPVRGTKNPMAKLTDNQVIDIRKDTRPSKAIAGEYQITPDYVNTIKRRGTWKHI